MNISLLRAAQIAKAAYDWKYAKEIPDFELSRLISAEATDTQGIAGVYGGDTLVVAFRGTTNIYDWITNANRAQQVVPYGNLAYEDRVHNGFMLAYYSVRSIVQDQVIGPSPLEKFVAIGHSLGGALALLCALDVQYNNPCLAVAARVLGCPKIGNAALMEAYRRRVTDTTAVIDDRDGVVKLPPGSDYAELGVETVVIGSHDEFGILSEMVKDHSLDKYFSILKKMEDDREI